MENSIDRFGSSEFADESEIAAAGYFRRAPDSLFAGFFGSRPLWYDGLGGVLLTAGARGGKLRDWIGYNVCGAGCAGQNVVVADPKGELAYVSQDLTAQRKFAIYWNPARLHGFCAHHINPVDVLRIDNAMLVADTKVFCQNMMPSSGSANASFFEQRARELLEAIILTLVRVNGVLTLPDLYHTINLIPAGGQTWLDFAFEMQESGFPISARIEAEIAAARVDPSGGYQGILGELFKAISPLSDEQLLNSVSPPFDFSFAQLCDPTQLHNIYLMPPAEYIEGWAMVIKAMFVSAMIHKSRAAQAPRQTFILDEAAQLSGGTSGKGGGFPLVAKLFTYGAGIGIRPVCVVQSSKQLNALSPDGENIITASAALRCYFATRDLESATTVSQMLGAQTLVWDDELQQARARHSSRQALYRILDGNDVLGAALDHAHHAREAEMPSKQHRLLRTPAEILGMRPDRMILFADGVQNPIEADRRPYYDQRSVRTLRFHPNPFYPPLDRVRVKTAFGHAWKRVVQEPVQAEFAHYPQYAAGRWSRVECRKWYQL